MSKHEILGNIRRGLGRSSDDAARLATVQTRLANHPSNLIPARAQLPHEEQIALFIRMAEEASAQVIHLTALDELPKAATDWLSAENVNTLVMAQDAALQALDWPSSPLKIESRVAEVGDYASLTTSFAGIAETGTLMLYSRAESPTTLNFLPDNHLVVLRKQDIVGPYEDAWQKLRAHTQGELPRTVNMITGPSRSADIEQKLQMGAHGPKKLVIFLIP